MKSLPRWFMPRASIVDALAARLQDSGAGAFVEHASLLTGLWWRSVHPPHPPRAVHRQGRLVRMMQGRATEDLEAFHRAQLEQLLDAISSPSQAEGVASAAALLRVRLEDATEGNGALDTSVEEAGRGLLRILAAEQPALYRDVACRLLEARPRVPLDGREWVVHDLLFGGARGPVEHSAIAPLSEVGFTTSDELDELLTGRVVLRACDDSIWPMLDGLTVWRARKAVAALPPLLCLFLVDGVPCAFLGSRTVKLPGFSKVPGRGRIDRAWVVALSALEARAMAAARAELAGGDSWSAIVALHESDAQHCRSLASSRDASIAALVHALEVEGKSREVILDSIVTAKVGDADGLAGLVRAGHQHEVLRHYLAIARPTLGAHGDRLFVSQGGDSMTNSRVARILGWDLAPESARPRSVQLRNGRGSYLLLGAARGAGDALDRMGDGEGAIRLWKRVLQEEAWPWPYAEAARRRLPDAPWTPEMARVLLGMPPGHPYRQQACDELQRQQPAWCAHLPPQLLARVLFEGRVMDVGSCTAWLQTEVDDERTLDLMSSLVGCVVVAGLRGEAAHANAWAEALLASWPSAGSPAAPDLFRVRSEDADAWFALEHDAHLALQAGDVEPFSVGKLSSSRKVPGPVRVPLGAMDLSAAPVVVREVSLRMHWGRDAAADWPGVLAELGMWTSQWGERPAGWVVNVVRSGLQGGVAFWCERLLAWLTHADTRSGERSSWTELLQGDRELLSGVVVGWGQADRARFVLAAGRVLPDASRPSLVPGLPTIEEASAHYLEHPDTLLTLSVQEVCFVLTASPDASWGEVAVLMERAEMREVFADCIEGLLAHLLASVDSGDLQQASRWAPLLLEGWEAHVRGLCRWWQLEGLEVEGSAELEDLLLCLCQGAAGELPEAVFERVCDGGSIHWVGRALGRAIERDPRLVITWLLDRVRSKSLSMLEGVAAWALESGNLSGVEEVDRALLGLRIGALDGIEDCPTLLALALSPFEAAAAWFLDRPEAACRLESRELVGVLFDAPEARRDEALRVAFHPALRDRFAAGVDALSARVLTAHEGEEHELARVWASCLVQNWAPQLRGVASGAKVGPHALTGLFAVDAGGDPAIEDLLMAMSRTRQGWVLDWIWRARLIDEDDAPAWVAPALSRVIAAEPQAIAGSLAQWLKRNPSKATRVEALSDEEFAKLGRHAVPKTRLALGTLLLAASDLPQRLCVAAWAWCCSVSPEQAEAADLLQKLRSRSDSEVTHLLRAGVGDDVTADQARSRLSWLLDHGLAEGPLPEPRSLSDELMGESLEDSNPLVRMVMGMIKEELDEIDDDGRQPRNFADQMCLEAIRPDGIVALADVPRLMLRASDDAWREFEPKLVEHLEADAGAASAFWQALLGEIGRERLPAALITDEGRALLRESFVQSATLELFAAVPPAAKALATAWLAPRVSEIGAGGELLIAVAGHQLAEIRSHALASVAAARLMPAQLLRIVESGHADVADSVAEHLVRLDGDELAESLVGMLDSPVASVRQLALDRLQGEQTQCVTPAIMQSLLSSPHADVEELALEHLESGALAAGEGLERLQELVMTRLRGGARLREAVRRMVDRGASVSTGLLLRVARGPHRADADWAVALLVERAAAGEPVSGVTLLESEGKENLCN